MVRTYMSKGMKRDKVLDIVGISKNQFYHEPNSGKSGRKASTITQKLNHVTGQIECVANEEVLLRAIHIKLDPDHAKWYRLITYTLQMEGYYINHKKLFRLMQEYAVLEERHRPSGKTYVKYRKVLPVRPLEIVEMDIKYIWITGSKKYAFVLTTIDTFTRYVLHWDLGYTMKSLQVKYSWEYIFEKYLQPIKLQLNDIKVEVRNDNGKQFESNLIRTFFKENNISHVFTKPYTPEENGHVESFHSIITKALERDVFSTLGQLEKRLIKFYTTYNNSRAHSGTKGVPPSIFWALFDQNKIDVLHDKEKHNVKCKLKVAYQEILNIPGINKYKYQHRAI